MTSLPSPQAVYPTIFHGWLRNSSLSSMQNPQVDYTVDYNLIMPVATTTTMPPVTDVCAGGLTATMTLPIPRGTITIITI